VIAEIDRSLSSHELIKVRVKADRDEREVMLREICARTGAQPVQHIGKILVVFRRNPEPDVSIRPLPVRRTNETGHSDPRSSYRPGGPGTRTKRS